MTSNALKIALAATLAISSIAVPGCASDQMAAEDVVAESTTDPSLDAVAATVNGTTLSEDTVAEYVSKFRRASGLEDASAWNDWLNGHGMTAENSRDEVIDYYVEQMLVDQMAEEEDLTVTDAEIDAEIAKKQANFPSEQDFLDTLEEAASSMDELRETVRTGLLETKIADKVCQGDVENYSDYFESYKSNSSIEVNPMPDLDAYNGSI